MSHSAVIDASLKPLACMPSEKGTNSASSTSFFFLPMARRSRSALPRRVAGELLRDRHDLLLVDDQAVGRAEDRVERLDHLGLQLALELRVDRDDLLLAVLAQRVVGVRVGAHRARAGRARGRPRCPRSCRAASAAAASAWGRRRAGRRRGCRRGPAARRWPGRSRSLRQRVEVDVLAAVGLDVGEGVVEDREVAQAEEVHLDQAERLAARVVELGDDLAVLQRGA